jgi:hypothetical protein
MTAPEPAPDQFSIPPGSVLVITQVEITAASTPAAGDQCEVVLELQTANSFSFLALHTDLCNATGRMDGTLTFPTGAVVKPGSTLCAVGFDFSQGFQLSGVFAAVHGFFAKDN